MEGGRIVQAQAACLADLLQARGDSTLDPRPGSTAARGSAAHAARQGASPMAATSSRWLMPIFALWARPYGLQGSGRAPRRTRVRQPAGAANCAARGVGGGVGGARRHTMRLVANVWPAPGGAAGTRMVWWAALEPRGQKRWVLPAAPTPSACRAPAAPCLWGMLFTRRSTCLGQWYRSATSSPTSRHPACKGGGRGVGATVPTTGKVPCGTCATRTRGTPNWPLARPTRLHSVVLRVSLHRVQLLVVEVEHAVGALHLLLALRRQHRRPPRLHSRGAGKRRA